MVSLANLEKALEDFSLLEILELNDISEYEALVWLEDCGIITKLPLEPVDNDQN